MKHIPLSLCKHHGRAYTSRLWTGHTSCPSWSAACCWWCAPHGDRASIHRHLSQSPCSYSILHDRQPISMCLGSQHGRMEKPRDVCLSWQAAHYLCPVQALGSRHCHGSEASDSAVQVFPSSASQVASCQHTHLCKNRSGNLLKQ